MDDINRVYLTWNDVDKLIGSLTPRLMAYTYDVMITITRGGIVPGAIIAERLAIPQVFVASVDFYEDEEHGKLEGDAFAWANQLGLTSMMSDLALPLAGSPRNFVSYNQAMEDELVKSAVVQKKLDEVDAEISLLTEKLRTLKKERSKIIQDPHFRPKSQHRALAFQVKKWKEFQSEFQKGLGLMKKPDVSCTICLEEPKRLVFSCTVCDKILCDYCKIRVCAARRGQPECPSCRTRMTEDQLFRRNRLAEKITGFTS